MEIERKWRLPRLPDAISGDTPRARIRQGYFVLSGAELRIRAKDDRHYFAVKSPGGLVRHEWEAEMPGWAFDLLWPHTEGARIEKTRYRLPQGPVVVEIDEYTGPLRGLITAEVEFADVTDATAYRLAIPDGQEVTEDLRFRNAALATTPDVSTLLE